MSRPIKVLSSDSPVFDGNEADVWVVNMTSSVGESRMKNITPGVLYTFVIRQDATGGHTFAWPSNCLNAPTISPAPNATTTANFIGQYAQTIISNIPATWS